MKKKSTRSALLMSFTSLLLCFAMLIGCTFAWFTDSVTSGVNKIVAGNLDIDVQYTKNGTTWHDLQGSPDLFGTALWEPGHTEYVTLKIENKGTLALNYKVMVTPVTEKGGVNVSGQSFKLSDYLKFGTTTDSSVANRAAARALVESTALSLNQANLTKTGTMMAGDDIPAQYITLVVYMPETVGNDANYKTGTAAPEIELGITVVATQLQSEADSFDNTYDANASDAEANGAAEYVVGPVYDYFPQVAASAPVSENNTNPVVVEATGKLNKNDGDTTLAKVTVPADAIDEDATEIKVSVIPKAAENTSAQDAIRLETQNGRETANFDIKVNGIKRENSEKITVEVFVGKGLANVEIYHDGSKITGADYVGYDANTGIVTFKTTSFSDYTVAYDAVCARIGEETYGSLALAFDAAQPGDTVTLLKDIDAGDAIAYANTGTNQTWNVFGSKAVTLDGDGHKLSGNAMYVLGFDQCTGAITIKNLTVKSTDESNTAAINLTGCSNVVLENITASGVKTGVIVNNSVATIKGANTNIANGAWHAVNVDAGGTGNPQTPVLTVEGGTIGKIVCERTGSANITGGTIEEVKSEGTYTGTISITGGTFDNDPSAYVTTKGLCAHQNGDVWTVEVCTEHTPGENAEYTMTETGHSFVCSKCGLSVPEILHTLEDGKCTVCDYLTDEALLEENPNYTCRIGNQGYVYVLGQVKSDSPETKASAINNAKDGDVIKLIANYSANSYWAKNFTNGETVTIDLNGKTIDYPSIELQSGKYNIIDSSENGNGKIKKLTLATTQPSYATTVNVYGGEFEKISICQGAGTPKDVNFYGGSVHMLENQGTGGVGYINIYGGHVGYLAIDTSYLNTYHPYTLKDGYTLGTEITDNAEKKSLGTESWATLFPVVNPN